MLRWFVNNLKANPMPIGIDFGTATLRLAQLAPAEAGSPLRLVAAAEVAIPADIRSNPAARGEFFVESVREALAQRGFRGRRVRLALPAAHTHLQHLRIAKMSEQELRQSLQWEAKGKLPIDPAGAVLRHVVAGDVHTDDGPRHEVLVMAATRETVNTLLRLAHRAALDVCGMDVEAKALVDCFGAVWQRQQDGSSVTAYIDIGASGTRMIVAVGRQLLFARDIPIGGEHLNRAAAEAFGESTEQARCLRESLRDVELAPAATAGPPENALAAAMPLLTGKLPAVPLAERRVDLRDQELEAQARRMLEACRPTVQNLVDELQLCRRYHEATFPDAPLTRLVFTGGEAAHKQLCQHVAKTMHLAAQLGDPLPRLMGADRCGLDANTAGPAWAVAIGLSAAEAAERAMAA